jgi:hypothetical protein
MDQELKQQLEWMNANLNTIAKNQVMIYAELREVIELLEQEKIE